MRIRIKVKIIIEEKKKDKIRVNMFVQSYVCVITLNKLKVENTEISKYKERIQR